MEAKIARNLKICESGLAKDPEDKFLQMVHGIITYRKDQDRGASEMETACTGLPQDIFPSKYLEMSYIFLIQHHARCQNREKVAKFIEEALADFCSDALMLQYLGEKLLFALGDAGYAVKVLNRASELQSIRYGLGPFGSKILQPGPDKAHPSASLCIAGRSALCGEYRKGN